MEISFRALLAGFLDSLRNNVVYCEGEMMRICPDLIRSEVRPCAEFERCVPDGGKAQCVCRPGYVKDLQSSLPGSTSKTGSAWPSRWTNSRLS
jgi:hypothetical protein